MELKGRNFLKLLDFTSEEIEYLIDLAADLKAKKKSGIPHRIHEGKNIALILFIFILLITIAKLGEEIVKEIVIFCGVY